MKLFETGEAMSPQELANGLPKRELRFYGISIGWFFFGLMRVTKPRNKSEGVE